MTKARGGKSVYGAVIGILMLEARFPRIIGDMGNALTWPFPVQYKVVRGASPDLVVRRRAEGTLDAFIAGGRELIAQGCEGITTNCGFLALFQAELSAALSVPVIASSLAQVNLVKAMLPPGKIPGILTVSAKALTPDHLKGAGVSLDTPIQGTENGREFTRALLDNELELDVELARQDNVEAAQELVRRHSEIGAIVLECTNMIPYAADIRRATGLPVYSIYDLVTWFHAGLSPRRFAAG